VGLATPALFLLPRVSGLLGIKGRGHLANARNLITTGFLSVGQIGDDLKSGAGSLTFTSPVFNPTRSGETRSEMAKQDKLNRVPPFIPLLWQAWRSSPSVRSMTMAQRGIFIEILIEQWIYGSFPRSAWELSRRIGSDFKTTGRLLEKYSELAVCCQCGASWTPVTCQCGASNLPATCHNPRLRNIRFDVDSDLAIGTTELNPTQPKLSEPHLASASPTGGGGGVSSSVVEGYFDQAKTNPAPSLLVDELVKRLGMVKPLDPATYGEWARRLGNLRDGWTDKYDRALSYVFDNPMYSRGIKTTKEDKSLWLMNKWESILAKMDADAEFASRKPKDQDNRPEYLKNPAGGVKFGKSVV